MGTTYNRFIACSYPDTHKHIATSADGITWTIQTDPFTAVGPTGAGVYWIGWDPVNERAVAVGANAEVAYSDDGGVTWTLATSSPLPFTSMVGDSFRVAYSEAEGVWLCSGSTNGEVFSSVDGDTWVSAGSTGDASYCYALMYGGTGVWLAGYSGGHIYSSDDNGATWTDRGNGLGGQAIRAGIWSESLSKFVIVGGQSDLATSDDDGVTWSTPVHTDTTTYNNFSVIDDGVNMIAGGSYHTRYSALSDLVSWNATGGLPSNIVRRTLAFAPDSTGLGTGVGRIVQGMQASGWIHYSDDNGVNWTASNRFDTNSATQISSIVWTGDPAPSSSTPEDIHGHRSPGSFGRR